MGQIVNLRLNQGETDIGQIGRRGKQGCCMSLLLFSLYCEFLMKKALTDIGNLKIDQNGRRHEYFPELAGKPTGRRFLERCRRR